ncbi:unnamed protein product [Soboliphyme baturini]|uniref:PID domain-containing protein n=1 Tax=Soboliphyme baturini TaxID=241478 RepID=A0A183J258_9BILA|nr:unnamed protein product [Soboliphyme baturini]
MCTSTGNYMCYVFHVEPSAGAIAKTIQAACKLRYQKVIDAHGQPNSENRLRNHQLLGEMAKTPSRGF